MSHKFCYNLHQQLSYNIQGQHANLRLKILDFRAGDGSFQGVIAGMCHEVLVDGF